MTDLENLIAMIDGKTKYEIELPSSIYMENAFPDCVKYVSIFNSTAFGHPYYVSSWYFDKYGNLIGIANWS